MRNRLQNLAYRFSIFMQGRYGDDGLNHVLTRVGLVLVITSLFGRLWTPLGVLSVLGMLVMWLAIFRMFSRNISKRQKEYMTYLRLTSGIRKRINLWKTMFRERNTHRYYKCPKCKAHVRIRKPPKGKNIAVRCSKCGEEFVKRT